MTKREEEIEQALRERFGKTEEAMKERFERTKPGVEPIKDSDKGRRNVERPFRRR